MWTGIVAASARGCQRRRTASAQAERPAQAGRSFRWSRCDALLVECADARDVTNAEVALDGLALAGGREHRLLGAEGGLLGVSHPARVPLSCAAMFQKSILSPSPVSDQSNLVLKTMSHSMIGPPTSRQRIVKGMVPPAPRPTMRAKYASFLSSGLNVSALGRSLVAEPAAKMLKATPPSHCSSDPVPRRSNSALAESPDRLAGLNSHVSAEAHFASPQMNEKYVAGSPSGEEAGLRRRRQGARRHGRACGAPRRCPTRARRYGPQCRARTRSAPPRRPAAAG